MRILLALLAGVLTAQAAFFNNYDPDVQSWRGRIVGQSSSLSSTGYVAGTRCMLNLKAAGVRRYIQRAGIYLGAGTNALKAPFINGSGTTTDTLLGFGNAGDYAESTGLRGSVNSVLNTGYFLNVSGVATNCHMAVYVRTASAENSASIGVQQSSSGAGGFYILAGYIDNNSYMSFSGVQTGAADASGVGLYVANKLSSSQVTYKNSVSLITATDATATVPDQSMDVHCINGAVGAQLFCTKYQSWYSVGTGIPTALQPAFFRIVQRVQYDMNRKVP